MGRDARFKPVKTTKKKGGTIKEGWRVEIPASYSKTGKRVQRSFTTREKAEEFAKPWRLSKRQVGQQRRAMAPQDADDAAKAISLLSAFDVSLTDAARFYIRHHDLRAKAPTVAEAWKAAISHRQRLSSRYLAELRQWERKLPSDFKSMNLADVEPSDVSRILDEKTKGATAWKNGLRYISAVFGDQVKRKNIRENPCNGVLPPKTKNSDEVVIYTVAQLEALFRACVLYPGSLDRDCRLCSVPFAFLAFAGIRPTELTRLSWDNVKIGQGFIRMSGTVTKTGETRNVPLNPTLLAWIETVPPEQRRGKIVPPRWSKKAARVKAEANLDPRILQDALRHSYASYSVAMDHNVDAVIAAMGHRGKAVFTKHYHNAVEKVEAEKYWALMPERMKGDFQVVAA